jgi:hypothetical protein
MILIIGAVFAAIPAVSVFRIGEGSLVNPWMLGVTVLCFGVGAAIGKFGVEHSVTGIEPRGLARRDGNGNFCVLKQLKQDERFVIVNRCLCIEKADGSIEKTEVAAWRLRREDWELVAKEYPDIGFGTS